MRSLREWLREELAEFRRPQALASPLAGMIALIVLALATGGRKGPDALAHAADPFSQGQLRALRFRRDARPGRLRRPQKTGFHTVLNAVDGGVLEGLRLRWPDQWLGPVQDRIVLVDGKKLRQGGVERVNAVSGAGRFLGGVITGDKCNELPAARGVPGQLDLAGQTVLAEAWDPNATTAQQILYPQGGDYRMTVNGHPPTLQKTLAGRFTERAFSPSTELAPANDPTGGQLRTGGNPPPGLPGGDAQPRGLSRSPAGGAMADARVAPREVERPNRVSVEPPHPR